MTSTTSLLIYRKLTSFFLLVSLCAVLTLAMQGWTGSHTIYQKGLSNQRLSVHQAIIDNQPPAGETWESMGARSLNTRILVPRLVDTLHRTSGLPVLNIYEYLDSVCLFLFLLLLYGYIGCWHNRQLSLICLLFVGTMLPLTYEFALFHPWDRISITLWLGLLYCLREHRLLPFAILLTTACLVKYDAIVLIGFYWLLQVKRKHWLKPTVIAFVLSLLVFTALWALAATQPHSASINTGFLFADVMAQIRKNIAAALVFHLYYPPLLVFAIPLALCLFGLKGADRFTRMSVLFALVMLGIFFVKSNFIEVRAQMMVLVLLLPAALRGLTALLEPVHQAAQYPLLAPEQ